MAKPGVKPMPESQKAEVRRTFIDAAKAVIREGGLEALNTKTLGLRAGYSHTSLYNYFGDVNEVLCLAVEELASECRDEVRDSLGTPGDLAAFVVSFSRLMIDHNTRNPQLYYPFLSTRIDFSYFQRRDGHPFVHPAYTLLLDGLGSTPSPLQGDERRRRVFADILTYIFHSKLHFFLRFGVPGSVQALQAEVAEEVRFLLFP
jgi:AcrR family transcriptional regulator